MNLLKLTMASGPVKGQFLYINKDKICGFTPIANGKGSNIRLDTGFEFLVEENVEDICKMLESSCGYLQITSFKK